MKANAKYTIKSKTKRLNLLTYLLFSQNSFYYKIWPAALAAASLSIVDYFLSALRPAGFAGVATKPVSALSFASLPPGFKKQTKPHMCKK